MKKLLKLLYLSAVVLAICYIASAFIFMSIEPYRNTYVRVVYVAVLLFVNLFRYIDDECGDHYDY